MNNKDLLLQIYCLQKVLLNNKNYFEPHDMEIPDFSKDIINSITLDFIISYLNENGGINA